MLFKWDISLHKSNEFDLVKILKTNDTFSKKKDNTKQLKKVNTSQDNPTSNINLNEQYRGNNDDDMDTYFTGNKILVITTKTSLNSKSAEYHHRNEVDKNKVQQEIKLQHNILTKVIKANN